MVMPPYWDNKALPKPTQNFIFNFSFIFIENKCLPDAIMRFEKKFGKTFGGFELVSIASKNMCLTINAPETDVWLVSFFMLTIPIRRWWAELV